MTRDYNAIGLTRFTAAAVELVPLIINGNDAELQTAVLKLYETARNEFPQGGRQVAGALNALCTELDLPTVFSIRSRDSGELLDEIKEERAS